MTAAVSYRIVADNPSAHLFTVRTTVTTPGAAQRFSMPVWIPGSYLVREFARHVVAVHAHCGATPVTVRKLDKNTWEAAPCDGPVVVTATIYAWDLSVRAAHLDNTHGFFNPTSLCFSFAGFEDRPCDVTIEAPRATACASWKVATTLKTASVDARGFGGYTATSYDDLIDHPVEMGTFETVGWSSGGVPHAMALTGRVRFDRDRLARDCERICSEHIAMFHGTRAPPMDRYLFLTTALGDGYGGLEHKDSTALICKRDDLPRPGVKTSSEGYRGFLGLVSHEYFHLWNVKRIKPLAFAPYRLDVENYTQTLWAFEGITSYYDDLALVRSGVISVEQWLELLAKTVTRVLRAPGRLVQSVAESSFDAWVKFYRPDENTPNAGVSYYTKGALVALALDLTIRDATQERRSLDDVMRTLWQRHGEREVGVPEDGVERIASEVAGRDLAAFFDAYVRGTVDVPLAALLAKRGIGLHLRASHNDSDLGGKPTKDADDDSRGSIGATVGGHADGALLTHVFSDGAAQRAGLSAGDVVVAVDGLRASRANFTRMLSERAPDSAVRLHVFRRDELFETTVTLSAASIDTAWMSLNDDDEANVTRRAALLRANAVVGSSSR